VVEYTDIDQCQYVLKPLGQCQIGAAGLGHAGRVVIAQTRTFIYSIWSARNVPDGQVFYRHAVFVLEMYE